uniref:Peptidase S1 domain-containing protein n=1 Tax=Angiostrongylus cantonensis TaxID=6313 RepID=A0A0K0DPL9_ANGCA
MSILVELSVKTLTCLLLFLDRSLGTRSFNQVVRNVYESRLLRVGYTPNAIQETYLGSSGEHVKGCQFLELVGNEDERMLGCWAIGDGSRNSRIGAKLACLKAKLDDNAAEKAAVKFDQICSCVSGGPPHNTLGLEFLLDGESVDISQPVLVDMTVAPVDSDVTCVLYVTAESRKVTEEKQRREIPSSMAVVLSACFFQLFRLTGTGISSMCKVVLQPLPALCLDGDDFEVRDSPIYNIRWSVESSAIYSCAWNSNKTRIALGMEEAAKIMDVITEKSFMISSRRRNVISQHFSSVSCPISFSVFCVPFIAVQITQNGDVIFMGLRDSDVILSDLRMKSHHVIGTLKGSRSSGWIKQLRMSYPQCIMIENFRGELKMYDSRQMSRELMSFSGHRNTHFRLPCIVDSQENFVFAGWFSQDRFLFLGILQYSARSVAVACGSFNSTLSYQLKCFCRQTPPGGLRTPSFYGANVKMLNESIAFLVDVVDNGIFPTAN